MTWVAEGIINKDQPWQSWRPRFLALRGSSVLVLDSPPLSAEDWDNKLDTGSGKEAQAGHDHFTQFKVGLINTRYTAHIYIFRTEDVRGNVSSDQGEREC